MMDRLIYSSHEQWSFKYLNYSIAIENLFSDYEQWFYITVGLYFLSSE